MPRRKAKRIVDIAPPGQERRDAKEPNRESGTAGERGGSALKKGGAVVVLGVLVILLMHFAFARATVKIRPESRQVAVTETVVVSPDAVRADTAARQIPGRLETETVRTTRLFAATGSSSDEDRAEGVIRVFNETPNTLPLVAATRFLSEEGRLFRTPTRVSVPGGGSVDVRVVAAESGEDYNIGPSNFSLPGLAGSELYTLIYAKSSEPMSGGSVQETFVVTEEDLERAQEALSADLREEAKLRMQERLPEGFVLDPDSFARELLQARSPVGPGSELKDFNYTVEASFTGLAFRTEDTKTLALDFLFTAVGDEEELAEDSLAVSWEADPLNPDTKAFTLRIQAEARASRVFQAEELKAQIQGQEREDAAALLQTRPQIASADVSLWPFWLRRIPEDPERISLEVLTD